MVTANAPVDIAGAEGAAPAGRHSGGRRACGSGEGAGFARASAHSTTRPRVASRCTPIRSGGTASGAAQAGDVLDFVRRVENLSLPEAIARLDGAPGPAPRAANRPAGPQRPKSAALAPRDPALLTAAGRFYAGQLRRSPAAWEYLASRGVGQSAAARLGLGYAPGSGLRPGPGVLRLLREAHPGLRAVHGERGGAVRRDGRRSRRLRRSRPLARRAGRRPRPDAPVPGVARPQAGAWDLGVSARRRPGQSWPRGSSTGSPWRSGDFAPAPPWARRAWSGSPRPFGAAPASSSPSTTTTRAARRRSGFSPCSDAGPLPSPFPRASATWPSLRLFPMDEPPSCACSRRPPAPPGSGSPPLPCGLPGPLHLSLTGLVPASPIPTLTTQEDLWPMHDGLRPPTDSHRACPVLDTGGTRTGHSLQEHTTQTEGDRHGQQERKQQRTQQRDRHRPRPQSMGNKAQRPTLAIVDASTSCSGTGCRPQSRALWGSPSTPRWSPQRKGRAGRTYDYLEGHVVIDQANRIFGFGGWGYELVGRRDPAADRERRYEDRRGEDAPHVYSAPVRVTVPGAPPRTDIGFNAVAEDNADGHETAIKGAVTDGMKRALRSFGVQFGNGFYGDQPVEEANGRRPAARQTGRASGGNTPPPARSRPGTRRRPARTTCRRCASGSSRSPSSRASTRTGCGPPSRTRRARTSTPWTASELAPLVEAAAKKLQETQQAKAA